MTVKIVGSDSISTILNYHDYVWYGKFQASQSGTVTEIKVYSHTNSGHARVAIYEDNGGAPGDLVTANNDSQSVTAEQWNTLTIGDTPIVKDTYYWIAVQSDVSGGSVENTSGDFALRYKIETYSGYTFPDPAPEVAGAYTDELCAAGYGTVPESGGLQLKTKKLLAAGII